MSAIAAVLNGHKWAQTRSPGEWSIEATPGQDPGSRTTEPYPQPRPR